MPDREEFERKRAEFIKMAAEGKMPPMGEDIEKKRAELMKKMAEGKLPPKGKMPPAFKKKSIKESIGKLVKYMKKHIPVIVVALVLAQIGMIFNLIGPGLLAKITALINSGLKTGIDVDAVTRIGLFLVTLYGIGFLLSIIQAQIMASVTQKVTKRLRNEIVIKINRLPLKFFDSSTTGDVLSRVINDVDTIAQTLNQSLGNLVSDVTMLVGCLVMMFITNWIMALSSVAASLLGFALMKFIVGKTQGYFIKQQYALGAINGLVEETYTGHTVVKAYGAEKQSKAIFDKMNKGPYKNAWKSQFTSGLMPPLMAFIGNLGYVVVCIVGAILTMNSIIGFEVIVAFMLYIRLFTQPLNDFATITTNIQAASAASDRVFTFLESVEMPDESDKKVIISDVKGDVEFDHVSFGYVPGKTIIHDFSASVKAGQKIAIVGPTGAGKTTMVNLLMRFYDVDSGKICIDGTPVQELTRENVHDLFCMVLQDTWLFEGSIKENVKYSKAEATDEDVVKACKAVGLHHFIETLPDGYDTIHSENDDLSAGQKQLLTIARAMVENAPMLILDEATSSVDTRTELLIQKAMDELTKDKTSFVIAHRLSTIKNADLIIFMKDGDVVESGSHDELLKKGGYYTELYNSQFETVA